MASGWSASRRRASVVLPVPEGALRMRSKADKRPPLFDVEGLLAQALQLGLDLDHPGGDAGVLRLRADGIDLAVDFLEQELQPAARGRAGFQERAELREVAGQAGQLLADVDAVGEE